MSRLCLLEEKYLVTISSNILTASSVEACPDCGCINQQQQANGSCCRMLYMTTASGRGIVMRRGSSRGWAGTRTFEKQKTATRGVLAASLLASASGCVRPHCRRVWVAAQFDGGAAGWRRGSLPTSSPCAVASPSPEASPSASALPRPMAGSHVLAPASGGGRIL